MKYKLHVPIQVGHPFAPKTVEHLEICSVSFAFEPERKTKGIACLSIVLCDPVTGWKHNVVYEDASALAVWEALHDVIVPRLMAKLVADGKFPPGETAEG